MALRRVVQKYGFLAVMVVCALTLCFVGVFALNISPAFTGFVDPGIVCKIEYRANAKDGFITLFANQLANDAEQEVQYDDYINSISQTNYINQNINFDRGVVPTVELRLTNYTTAIAASSPAHASRTAKHIRLIVTTSQAGVTLSQYSAICPAPASGSSTTSVAKIALSGVASAQVQNVQFTLQVQEVFLVTIADNIGVTYNTSSIYYYDGTNQTRGYYFSPLDAVDGIISVPAEAAVGFQLAYPYINQSSSNPLSGSYPLPVANLGSGFAVNTRALEVFKIYENRASTLGLTAEHPTTTIPWSNSNVYLPNNGDYTLAMNGSNATFTRGANFTEYKYYVEMGQYPQTLVSDANVLSALNALSESAKIGEEMTHTLVSDIPASTDTKYVTMTLQRYVYNNNQYVREMQLTEILNAASQVISSQASPGAQWYLVEPILWIVLGAQHYDGTDVINGINALTFSNNMFYENGLPFRGSLVLMSAYLLDGCQFGSSGWANFATSTIFKFMNGYYDTIGGETVHNETFSSLAWSQMPLNKDQSQQYQIADLLALDSANQKQIKYHTYQTRVNSGISSYDITDVSSNFFLLGGHQKPVPSVENEETYYSGKYFSQTILSSGVQRPTGAGIDSVRYSPCAVIAPTTDFARAHYVEISATSASSDAGVKIWGIKQSTTGSEITRGSGTYKNYIGGWWTSSGAESSANVNMAYVCTLNGQLESTAVTDTNFGVRPCMLLNLNYDYTKTH